MIEERQIERLRNLLAEVDRCRAMRTDLAVRLQDVDVQLARAMAEFEREVQMAAAAEGFEALAQAPSGILQLGYGLPADLPASDGHPKWTPGPVRDVPADPAPSQPAQPTQPPQIEAGSTQADAPRAQSPAPPAATAATASAQLPQPAETRPQPEASRPSRKRTGRPMDPSTLELVRYLKDNPRPEHAALARIVAGGRDDRAARNRASTRLRKLEASGRIRRGVAGWEIIDVKLLWMAVGAGVTKGVTAGGSRRR